MNPDSLIFMIGELYIELRALRQKLAELEARVTKATATEPENTPATPSPERSKPDELSR